MAVQIGHSSRSGRGRRTHRRQSGPAYRAGPRVTDGPAVRTPAPHCRAVSQSPPVSPSEPSTRMAPPTGRRICRSSRPSSAVWPALVHRGGRQPGDPAGDRTAPRRRSPSATYGFHLFQLRFPRPGLAGPLSAAWVSSYTRCATAITASYTKAGKHFLLARMQRPRAELAADSRWRISRLSPREVGAGHPARRRNSGAVSAAVAGKVCYDRSSSQRTLPDGSMNSRTASARLRRAQRTSIDPPPAHPHAGARHHASPRVSVPSRGRLKPASQARTAGA
jgi:hypothetical protein